MAESGGTVTARGSVPVRASQPRSLTGAPPLPRLLPAASLLLLAATVVHTIACYRTGGALDIVSGAWAALADDLYHGTLYRPLLGELGWGGTRAFPLYFSLHALAMRAGMSLVTAGYLLSGLAALLAVFGAYFLLRRLAVRQDLAWLCALWVLAPLASQKALASFHPDLLAVGFAACGLAVCLGPENRRNLLIGALLFTLAFAAKMTAIAAPVAVFLYWMGSQRRRAALQLAAILAIFCATVLTAMQAASQGRALGVLFASGGVSVRSLLLSGSSFWQVLLYDPITAAFLMLGLFAAFTRAAGPMRVARIWLFCALAVAVLIYSAPGASTNHLLEMQLAAVVVIGGNLSGRRTRALAITASAVVLFAAFLSLRAVRSLPPNLTYIQNALRAAGTGERPILAEDPLVPILAGQRPRALDPFMINLLAGPHPEVRTSLHMALTEHAFGAVILDHDPATPEGRRWYASTQFGSGFVEALQQYYVRVPSPGPLVVFKPK